MIPGVVKSTNTIESTTIMMPDTITLGSDTYTKQSQDAVTGVHYEVAGRALSEKRSLTFKTLVDKSGTRRTLIDASNNNPVAGSTNGSFKTARVYLNVVIPNNVAGVETAAEVDQFLTCLSGLGDPAGSLTALIVQGFLA